MFCALSVDRGTPLGTIRSCCWSCVEGATEASTQRIYQKGALHAVPYMLTHVHDTCLLNRCILSMHHTQHYCMPCCYQCNLFFLSIVIQTFYWGMLIWFFRAKKKYIFLISIAWGRLFQILLRLDLVIKRYIYLYILDAKKYIFNSLCQIPI